MVAEPSPLQANGLTHLAALPVFRTGWARWYCGYCSQFCGGCYKCKCCEEK
jgi:hypothetical protein